ncbi:Tc toxin subunit A [Paenibacillus alvei]|uniref:Tc toxin subunit A n=2 Tax=Paenibacillus alvei TaxID=44250 RepID=A0ABT4H5F2_PAEAL|nr:Tc toxin subunit A [Paenibacillus alvei]EJW20249.1 insecticidal toxin complex protein [Paenibacillus alvei DSM 29]MCY7488078.1 Tc toxin subunit A [Paenibacillus alvei]MCY9544069.1 Tc toxin subunit A [Paenibacillus alvei]MCY9702633.1 Tc toxin subunit A [Paenibacillus alvei]MCY9734150.1 Tc toxin subunit A [Paenibacillus alvei]
MVSTTDNTAGVFRLGTEELTEALKQSGYRTVFDIASENLAEFQKSNPEIPSSDAKEIHQLAVQRTENLYMLYRAWQLHNDPVVQSLPKLSADTGLQGMRAALERSLGGGADFGDLFPERSPEGYAEASSIQSLFSPGRYLTVLYKIARDLHDPKDKLHIDNRRPDLKSLILNNDNMNREVSSLDILLDVLQPEGSGTLASLKDTYYPMNLPYDDDLAQINAVAEARSSNLLGIWDTLLDTQRTSILQDSAAARRISKTRHSEYANQKASDDEPVFITGEEFYLETGGKRLFLAHKLEIGSTISAKINIGPPQAADIAPARLQLVYYGRGGRGDYFLRVADDVSLGGKLLTNCYLTSDDGQSNNISGPYCLMINRGTGSMPSGTHLPVQIERVTDTSIRIFVPDHGYLGLGKSLASNWNEPLALNLDLDEALTFTLRKNETGNDTISIIDMMPPVADTTPSPPTRETLSLTPNSFRLLVNPEPTAEDIAKHFNITTAITRAPADLAAVLNVVDDFCLKTGLSFNELLDLTMQKDYQAKSSEYESRFVKFGGEANVPVSTYGAVFLTGTEETPLWVKQYNSAGAATDTPVLNFTPDNVVALAGRAEKIVRLARSTGLSFEQLDWLITNASRAVIEHGGELILDRSVLDAVAEFTRLQTRYGITSDMFAAFIGDVNTYTEAGKDSFYQTMFSTADHSATLPLGATLQFEVSKQDRYESICCGAMGVTADEFSRIGKYCFGDKAQQITANETTVAQLYRLGRIPHMLGLRFTEAELLWKLMAGGEDTLLRTIGTNPRSLEALEIIRRTEVLLDWMDAHQLDVVSLQAMVTNRYSDTATPELYNFLAQVHQSASSAANVARVDAQDTLPADKLLRALAAGFKLKANVMARVIDWMDKTDGTFTLRAFWDKLQAYFSADHEDELMALEGESALLQWCQQISQYALIVRWCGLSEQDLALLIGHPEQLLDGQHTVPVPSLHLLLVLTRLKEWQQRVQVSSEEAMRYFAQAHSATITRDTAVKLLAHIHGWNEADTASMNDYLLGENEYPKNFDQIFTLESWVNLGRQLNVGSRTLGELVDMAEEDKTAENMDLITSVAHSLMAAAQA